METNLDVELITEFAIQMNIGFTVLIHYPFLNSTSPNSPLENLPGYTVKGFF